MASLPCYEPYNGNRDYHVTAAQYTMDMFCENTARTKPILTSSNAVDAFWQVQGAKGECLIKLV